VKRLVALVAHDGRKHELLELVRSCLEELRLEHLVATEGTGRVVEETFDLEV
jgi:methylglyoxal synthase